MTIAAAIMLLLAACAAAPHPVQVLAPAPVAVSPPETKAHATQRRELQDALDRAKARLKHFDE